MPLPTYTREMQRFFLLFKRPLGMIVVNATCAVSGEILANTKCSSRRFLTVYDLQSTLDNAGLLNEEAKHALEVLRESAESFIEVDEAACTKLGLLGDVSLVSK